MPDRAALRLRLTALPGQPLLVLDPLARRVTLAGRDCAINGRAFDLLQRLGAAPGQPQAAQLLHSAVWAGRVVEPENLRAQIRLLRGALGAAAVRTLSGRGYALMAEAEAEAEAVAGHRHPPRPDDELLGRAADLAALQALMQAQRLVTLLGPGGVGKSRLARQALQALQSLAWLDLAALPAAPQDPQAVARALTAALPPLPGLRLGAAPAPRDSMPGLAHAPWQGWLLLDNAEHLVGGSGVLPRLVQSLLDAASGLRVLVTSQRPLGLAAEAAYRLAPLPLPAADLPLSAIQANPAMRLLLSRASAADQRFVLADEDGPAAVAIVRRLDGLPLAIELAGPWLPLLGAAVLAERLNDPLQLLGTPRRPRAGRHATLRSAVEWSVGLLSPAEQQALMALALFAAPFRSDTAAALLCALGLDATAAQRQVQALVDQSLLLPDSSPPVATQPRLRLLAGHRAWAQQALLGQGVNARRAVQSRYVRLMAAAAGDADADADRIDLLRAMDLADALGDTASAAALRQAVAGLRRRTQASSIRPPPSISA